MRKLTILFAILAIVSASSFAIAKRHSPTRGTFTNWFEITANVTPAQFQSCGWNDIATYDENALTAPPPDCLQLGSKLCAVLTTHWFDADVLDQSDLTTFDMVLEIRYKN